jgi:hypothetical protein
LPAATATKKSHNGRRKGGLPGSKAETLF